MHLTSCAKIRARTYLDPVTVTPYLTSNSAIRVCLIKVKMAKLRACPD